MIKMPMRLLGVIFIAPILSDAAYAATRAPAPSATPLMRTYVSGLGSDGNPCTAASPCAPFQAALALTLAGFVIARGSEPLFAVHATLALLLVAASAAFVALPRAPMNRPALVAIRGSE